MAFSVVASASAASSNGTSCTTSAINCSGADLIVIAVQTDGPTFLGTSAITDSEGNSYTHLIDLNSFGSGGGAQLAFVACGVPSTSSSMTFTASYGSTVHPTIAVIALAGSGATSSSNTALDQSNSDTNGVFGGPTVTSGSVTPTQNNEIVISAVTSLQAPYSSAPTAATETVVQTQLGVSGFSRAIGLAYQIQTSRTAINETWTTPYGGPGNTQSVALIVSFQGPIAPTSAHAKGLVQTSGSATLTLALSASALGIVHCSGSATALTPRIALIGQVATQGSIQATLGVLAQGLVRCSGFAAPTVAAQVSAVGVVQCSGSAFVTINAKAQGVVHCYGWCVIGLNGSLPACLTANPPWMPPPVQPIANYVY
jgi:hypothetical protein